MKKTPGALYLLKKVKYMKVKCILGLSKKPPVASNTALPTLDSLMSFNGKTSEILFQQSWRKPLEWRLSWARKAVIKANGGYMIKL